MYSLSLSLSLFYSLPHLIYTLQQDARISRKAEM